MSEQWKMICRLKDIPLHGLRLVPRGLAWQELPGALLYRADEEVVLAALDRPAHQSGPHWPPQDGARTYSVKLEEGRVYLDLEELCAPASKAEAALAGSLGVAQRVMVLG